MGKNNETDMDRWIDERFAALSPGEEWEPNTPRAWARFQERCGVKQRRGSRWPWVALAAVAAGLTLVATPVTRSFAELCVSKCVKGSGRLMALLTDAASSAPSSTYVKPDERKLAPDFTLDDASGTPVKLSGLRGKVVLLNFWATWCGPCKVEIPLLIGFQKTYRDRDFEVLGVALDDDGWTSVRPYLAAKNVNYRVMIGTDEVTRLYGGLEAVPTTLIIDRSGRIASIHLGLCTKSEYETDIKAVLNEQ